MAIDWQSGEPAPAIEEYLLWSEAIEAADNGNSKPLVALLRSHKKLRAETRALLADLLERHTLANKPGRQATPAYRVTPTEGRMDEGGGSTNTTEARGFRMTRPSRKR